MSKKIAFLSTFYPYRGGIAQFNASLYRAFEQAGHAVSAFTFKRQYPEILFPGSSQFASPEDASDQIPAQRVLDTINPLTYLSAASTIAKFEPDILLMKYWMPFFAPGLGTVARRLRKQGTKVIPILDNVIPHEKRLGDEQLNRYFLNSADGFVAMSSSVKQDLLSLKPDARTLFHPHPLYSHFGDKLDKRVAQQQLGIPAGKKVLLFFGLIRAYKGLDLLIEAFARLSEDYYLLIAGESYEDYSKYQQAIDQNPNRERIQQHVRYISDEEVPVLFSASDVSVLPYKSATQSGVVSIAFHFGLPVIVTDVGSLKEMVTTYEGGQTISQPSAALIESGVREFFNQKLHESLPLKIAAQKARYNWDNLAHELIDFSEKL